MGREVHVTTSRRAADRHARRALGWVLEVLAFSLVSWGIWLVSLSVVDPEDLLVAGLTSLVCGVVAAGTRRAIGARWRPTLGLVPPLALWPLAVVADSAAVLTLPLRRVRAGAGAGTSATLERVDLGASGQTARARAQRAIVATVVTSTPATVVLDVEERTGTMVVHALSSPGPKLHEAYARR